MTEILNVPWVGVTRGSCEVQSGHAKNTARGFEYDQTLDLASPRWMLDIELSDRDPAVGGVLRAFLARLAFNGGRFRCHDPLRRRPLAYQFGTTRPWLANPAVETSIVSQNLPARTVTIGGLVVGAVVSPGDACSWAWSGEQRLYRVLDMAPVVANGAGQVTIMTGPRPRVAVAGTPVRFDNATSVFEVVGQSPASIGLKSGPLPIDVQISAMEVF
jgi:hypothetical protein